MNHRCPRLLNRCKCPWSIYPRSHHHCFKTRFTDLLGVAVCLASISVKTRSLIFNVMFRLKVRNQTNASTNENRPRISDSFSPLSDKFGILFRLLWTMQFIELELHNNYRESNRERKRYAAVVGEKKKKNLGTTNKTRAFWRGAEADEEWRKPGISVQENRVDKWRKKNINLWLKNLSDKEQSNDMTVNAAKLQFNSNATLLHQRCIAILTLEQRETLVGSLLEAKERCRECTIRTAAGWLRMKMHLDRMRCNAPPEVNTNMKILVRSAARRRRRRNTRRRQDKNIRRHTKVTVNVPNNNNNQVKPRTHCQAVLKAHT